MRTNHSAQNRERQRAALRRTLEQDSLTLVVPCGQERKD